MRENQSMSGDLTFLTGATGFIGSRLALALLARGRKLALMCRPASISKLESWLNELPDGLERPWIVAGDLQQSNLGFSTADRERLSNEVGDVFHLAAGYDLHMSEQQARDTNVDGTRRLLEWANGLTSIRRFHFVSTMAVAGDFQGNFLETELDLGQSFVHAYGHSKFLAEHEVVNSHLPVTVYRPGIVVGDSRTGEMDKVDGPYFVFDLLHRLSKIPGARRMPMIVPRGDDARFHIAPVDFVVEAMCVLSRLEQSLGRTYHLLDPQPMSFRQFYIATLAEMGFSGPTIARPIERLFKLLCMPGLWQICKTFGRISGLPAEMIPHATYKIHYDTTIAEADLADSGVSCPPLHDYLPKLIEYFRASMI